MSYTVLLLISLCAGIAISLGRFLLAELPSVLDRSVPFQALPGLAPLLGLVPLPGLVPLLSHDTCMRAAQARPGGRPTLTVAGRRCLPEPV